MTLPRGAARGCLAGALLMVLALSSGCARDRSTSSRQSETGAVQAPAAPGSRLVPLPEPELDSLEATVRREMTEARAGLEESLRRSESDKTLADEFGALGKLYLAHSLLDPAATCFHDACLLAPEEFRWAYYLGRASVRRNDPQAARAAFERALALRPGDQPTLVALGELALGRNEPAVAEELFGKVLDADPASAPARFGLGRAAASRGDPAGAVDHFEEALRLQPQAVRVHYSLAMALRDLGEVERARRHLDRRGERQPVVKDPLMEEVAELTAGARIHLLRAGRALSSGRLDEGTQELRLAVELDPLDATSRVTLGAVLAQQGDRQGAREQFEEALRIAPGNAKAHYNLGVLLVEEGADREPVGHFQRALEIDPTHGRAAFQLGSALMRLSREEEAIPHLAQARELEPANESVRLREIAALVRAGRYAEARSRVEEGRGVLPQSVRLKHALARLLAAAPDDGVRDGARSLALAIEVARDGRLFEGRIDLDHGQTLAMAYAEIGQFDRAVALQQALVAAAERDGQLERLSWLSENLARFRRESPCRVPWPAGDPFLAAP